MRLTKLAACSVMLIGCATVAEAQSAADNPTNATTTAPLSTATTPSQAATVRTAPAAGPSSFFNFSDTSIGYRWQPLSKEPAVRQPNSPTGADINKNIIAITHADAYKYGSNFINLDILKSNSPDLDEEGKRGAWEAYLVYRGQLSPNSIFNTTAFTFGPIRDITFEAGFDHNTKNTTFGSYKWLAVVGPNIHFNVPGFMNLGVHYAHEWNHNGVVGKNVDFDSTLELELVYQFPLGFTGLPLRLEGFANYITPKGRDGFGNKTREEALVQTRLTLDLGAVAFNKARILDVSAGFQYWYNKFGNDHTRVPGSLETTPFLATRVHF